MSRKGWNRVGGIFAFVAAVLAHDAVSEKKCQDRNNHCSHWARIGECEANPVYMEEMCQKSCRLCTKGSECADKSRKCLQMADHGACQFNASQMSEDCPETCKMCGPDDPCRVAEGDLGFFGEPGELDINFRRIVSDPAFQAYGIEVLSEDPWVVVFENLFLDDEVDEVLAQFKQGWKRSEAGGIIGAQGVFQQRTSEQIWCPQETCGKTEAMERFTKRIENITGFPRENFEDIQILRYQKGQKYSIHSDMIDKHSHQPCGQRLMTFFVYLADVPEAGTRFHGIQKTVQARKGRAVLWANVLVNDSFAQEKRTQHSGLVVPEGRTKYSANIWIHRWNFQRPNMLGCLLADRALRYRGSNKRAHAKVDEL